MVHPPGLADAGERLTLLALSRSGTVMSRTKARTQAVRIILAGWKLLVNKQVTAAWASADYLLSLSLISINRDRAVACFEKNLFLDRSLKNVVTKQPDVYNRT
jgi:hypothetical protein